MGGAAQKPGLQFYHQEEREVRDTAWLTPFPVNEVEGTGERHHRESIMGSQ